jgi:diacylglycerol kinase (ATP)
MRFFLRFKYAFEGLFYLLKKDNNIQLHLVFFVFTVCLGLFYNISHAEWLSVLICSALVIAFEAINSSIEKLADFIHKEKHEEIKIIKDVSAAAVLIVSIFSFVVALWIFLPRI